MKCKMCTALAWRKLAKAIFHVYVAKSRESSFCAYSRVAVVVIHPGTHWFAKAKHVVAKAKVPNSSEFYINVCSRKLAKADLKHFSRESYVARGESVAKARA